MALSALEQAYLEQTMQFGGKGAGKDSYFGTVLTSAPITPGTKGGPGTPPKAAPDSGTAKVPAPPQTTEGQDGSFYRHNGWYVETVQPLRSRPCDGYEYFLQPGQPDWGSKKLPDCSGPKVQPVMPHYADKMGFWGNFDWHW